MKTTIKLVSVTFLGFLLSGCLSTQVQNEGGSAAQGVGSTHKHLLPDGSKKAHTHDGDLSRTHTHNLDQM